MASKAVSFMFQCLRQHREVTGERAVLVANEYVNTNPALSEGERKRIAWQRAQKKNPELFGK